MADHRNIRFAVIALFASTVLFGVEVPRPNVQVTKTERVEFPAGAILIIKGR
jgi:hypothetical protein